VTDRCRTWASAEPQIMFTSELAPCSKALSASLAGWLIAVIYNNGVAAPDQAGPTGDHDPEGQGFLRTSGRSEIERSETTGPLPALSVRGPRSATGRWAGPAASPGPDRAGTGREGGRPTAVPSGKRSGAGRDRHRTRPSGRAGPGTDGSGPVPAVAAKPPERGVHSCTVPLRLTGRPAPEAGAGTPGRRAATRTTVASPGRSGRRPGGRDPTGPTSPPVGGRARAGTAAGPDERSGRTGRTGLQMDQHRSGFSDQPCSPRPAPGKAGRKPRDALIRAGRGRVRDRVDRCAGLDDPPRAGMTRSPHEADRDAIRKPRAA
jgi:hypothetical protein